MEIANGTASFARAQQRMIFPLSRDQRIEWDAGYEDCVCAHRLGHDVKAMMEAGIFEPSLLSPTAVIIDLLDGKWTKTRPEPRK